MEHGARSLEPVLEVPTLHRPIGPTVQSSAEERLRLDFYECSYRRVIAWGLKIILGAVGLDRIGPNTGTPGPNRREKNWQNKYLTQMSSLERGAGSQFKKLKVEIG